jgi:hypothetical protein
MGDRAWVGITFYSVPQRFLRNVFKFMDDNALGVDGKTLILGAQYTAEEMLLGWVSDEVARLVRQAPGIVVQASQGNRYEFNGEVLVHTPDLGTFLSDVDGGDNVILSNDLIDKTYNDLLESCNTDVYTPTAEQFKEALDRAAGIPWFTQISKMADFVAANPAQRTLIRPPEDERPIDLTAPLSERIVQYLDHVDAMVATGEHIDQDLGVAQVLDELRVIVRGTSEEK